MDPKPVSTSLLWWIGIITSVTGVLELLSKEPWIADYPKASAALLVVVGVLTAVRRLFTVAPVTLFGNKLKS